MMGRCSSSSNSQSNHSYSSPQFPVPNGAVYDNYYDHPFFDSSPSVDCTLSLGTPSTRLVSTEEDELGSFSSASYHNVSQGFAWDPYGSNQMTRGRRGSGSNASNGGDSLLARRCANCDTTTTPLWRNGPRGPKSLCNACGIRFKKEERRANARNGAGGHRNPCYSPATTNEFMFIDDVSDGDFLSWGLNGGDRHGLIHDFTI